MSDLSERVVKSRGLGLSDDQIVDYISKQPDYSDKVTASRKAGASSKDILDHLAKVPEQHSTAGSVLSAVGRGGVGAAYDLATLPYGVIAPESREKLKGDILSSAPKPVTKLEKFAEGAGEGAVATIPGVGVGARLASLPGKVGQVGRFLADSPGMQTLTGAVSGGTEKATGSPGAGLATAAAVPVAGMIGRKVATPNLGSLVGDQFRLKNLAESLGIPLSAADKTGNRILKQAEAVMRTLPGSSGVMQKADVAKREAFNQEVLNIAGINEKYATPSVLEKAHDSLGTELDNLAAQSSAILDRPFAQEIYKTVHDFGRRLPTDVAPVFKSYVDDLSPYVATAMSGGQPHVLTGQEYDEIRKGIARRMRNAKDPGLKEALSGLVDALDGAMERSAPAALKPLWQDARRRYSALMTVESAMSHGTAEDRTSGNIPFGGFKQAVLATDRAGFSRGRGQFNDLARVGEFIAPKLPSSGTSERSHMTRLLTGAGPAAGITYGLTTGDIVTPALALGTPYGAAKLYNSKAITDWLSNQVQNKGLLQTIQESGRAVAPQAARQQASEPTP